MDVLGTSPTQQLKRFSMCHVAMVGLDVTSCQDVREKWCSEWDPEALNMWYWLIPVVASSLGMIEMTPEVVTHVTLKGTWGKAKN